MIALTNDSWNDYGYETLFGVKLITRTESIDLGSTKILHRNQAEGRTPIKEEFRSLNKDYCSLGQSTSFYEILRSQGKDVFEPVLSGLRDVVFNPGIASEFEHLEGFQNSLLRNSSARRALVDGPLLFSVQATPEEVGTPIQLRFLSNVGGKTFSFDLFFDPNLEIPGRTAALIGYNGSGKTRLLANIAMVAATPEADREDPNFTRKYGEFATNFDFGGVFAVSFSAFDDFEIPGRNLNEKESVRERKEEYLYCGLRSLEFQQGDDLISESDTQLRLKSPREILGDFENALRRIHASDRRGQFIEALKPISMEPSFARFNLISTLTEEDDSPLLFFRELSTGHKIVINVITQLSAYLRRKSLILFDEPESHLHPPLLAALLKSIRLVLGQHDSYCLFATHSPVVLQETPRRFVYVIRRNGPKTHVTTPQIETFGENVGTLTHEVFSLDSSRTDFHDVLADLAADRSLAEIENLFGGPLGFQARSYLLKSGAGSDEESANS